MKNLVFIAFLSLFSASMQAQRADFHVIPLPKEIKTTQAAPFELNKQTLICYPSGDKELRHNAEFLKQYISELTGLELTVTNLPAQQHCIKLTRTLHSKNPEAYSIRVNSDIVLIEAASAAGSFYGIQTLRKALPTGTAQSIVLPATELKDYPRFSYRGAHLDVARHFVTPDSVRRFIDILALHNINNFHWHLTDDQGWRLEIKRYPRLTQIGAQREGTVIGHNSGKYDEQPYGGYYTQKEVREILKYAAERHINVIPEIDLPGHMLAALAAYPELGCTGGPYKVWQQWGVSDDVLCAGNDKALEFIDGVLTEVARLFPSNLIHVGGDECPKTRWKACPKCQARIQALGLKDNERHTAEQQLQSYVINHAQQTLSKLGRQMIGWEETIEGGLAPGAWLMSWTGEGAGFEAASEHHKVVMSPCTYLYFDYYQSDDKTNEPDAAGGYLPIERVYNYEPIPASLSEDARPYIVGVQANCWTEYMPSFRQVEYMVLPRLAALSEIQWSASEQKNYADFIERLPHFIDTYRQLGYNFSRAVYRVHEASAPLSSQHTIKIQLSTIDNAPIHYTLDGSKPTLSSAIFRNQLLINQASTLRAAAFRPWGETPEVVRTYHFSKATACSIKLLQEPHPSYRFSGPGLLVDGLWAEDTNFHSGHWIGFCGNDLEAVIDLGKEQQISMARVRTCVEKGAWVFDARGFEIAVSTDAKDFRVVAHADYPAQTEDNPNQINHHSLNFPSTKARYVKVKVVSEHSIPDWHPGKGHPGFVFVDEIEVQ